MENQDTHNPPWGTPRNTSGRASIGLIGSKTRRQPGKDRMNLPNLLEKHAKTFEAAFLFVTWGTYYDLLLDSKNKAELKNLDLEEDERKLEAYKRWGGRWNHGGDPRYKYGYALSPGKRGGLVEMAEHLEGSAGRDRIETLILLTDPTDLEESYPEDRALLRSALRNNALLLVTDRSVSHWAAFEQHTGIPHSGKQGTKRTDPEQETLALIAHDNKKLELCLWVVRHRRRIRRFQKFVTTGTTGQWVQNFLEAAGVPRGKTKLMDQMLSGPMGGDIEIAGAVLRGEIQHVVFFVDPMTSHPHEADVQAFVRICTMPHLSVNLRLNEKAATSWIETL